jgi:hypothetical protein
MHCRKHILYDISNITCSILLLFLEIYSKTSDPVVNRAYFNGINQVSEKVNASFEKSVNGL